MKPYRRFLPPAATPLTASDIWTGIRGARAGDAAVERLAQLSKAHFGASYCSLVSSGRAALSLILLALKKLSSRSKIIIPAYTSFSVPAAIVRAGFRVTLCDINPVTLDFDLNHLESLVDQNTLAVIPNHLFGFPSDLDGIMSIAKPKGAFVVEDAAQALGARYKGGLVGTIGDVGFFSLGRGKNITAVDGGIIITNSRDIRSALDRIQLHDTSRNRIWGDFLAAAALGILVKPQLYWLPREMPWLKIGVSEFEPDFPIGKLPPFRAGLALAMLGRADTVTSIRQANAGRYLRSLEGVDSVDRIAPAEGAEAVYLRFPILVPNPEYRSRLFSQLQAQGLGVSPAYPVCLADVEKLRDHLDPDHGNLHGARLVARWILTLPTHPFVVPDDIAKAVQIIRRSGEASICLQQVSLSSLN